MNAEWDFPFKISASVGIAQFNPAKHKNLMLFVHEADAEMYVQKVDQSIFVVVFIQKMSFCI